MADKENPRELTRRELLGQATGAFAAAQLSPFASFFEPKDAPLRCINVVNFIRGVEPRGPMDLFLPVQKQMEVIRAHRLPATWLFQYDALILPQFTDFILSNADSSHEVGFWFEMNQRHCEAAGVEWRGRPGYEWDHYPSVAFTIGYKPEERKKLADAAMKTFKEVWGKYPKSVASWNLDSITIAHLVEHYQVQAFAVCRDQIATDGFTIWGAPIAGYYPSRTNCWSPAVDRQNQISAPIFRMLGQDPVYYYQSSYPFPDGSRHGGPDTMEPVWPSGRSQAFVNNFLKMISSDPTLQFAYAQLGQENSFGWPQMEQAYPMQMKALAELRKSSAINVETMAETGRRFQKKFKATPAQAQVMLRDPFGNKTDPEQTIWYQSRNYRTNLHIRDGLPFIRDLTVYSDQFAQPFLHEPTRQQDVEQRMPALLDGYHWSRTPGSAEPGAAFLLIDGERMAITEPPKVTENGNALVAVLRFSRNRQVVIRFEERRIRIQPSAGCKLTLSFEWEPSKMPLPTLSKRNVAYEWQGFHYGAEVVGELKSTNHGWQVLPHDGKIEIHLEQR